MTGTDPAPQPRLTPSESAHDPAVNPQNTSASRIAGQYRVGDWVRGYNSHIPEKIVCVNRLGDSLYLKCQNKTYSDSKYVTPVNHYKEYRGFNLTVAQVEALEEYMEGDAGMVEEIRRLRPDECPACEAYYENGAEWIVDSLCDIHETAL